MDYLLCLLDFVFHSLDFDISLNKRLNSLAFSDVTRLVYELLRGGETDAQMLYFRLDGRINHLLIDEFQDTNVAQYEIMRPLIEEIVAGYGQNGLGSFFYVGDVKLLHKVEAPVSKIANNNE